MISFRSYNVIGTTISAVDPPGACELILRAASTSSRLQVHLCNSYTVALASSDPRLRQALELSDLNIPDGTPVALLGRREGVRGPVRGPTLVRAVFERSRDSSVRHYLYGGAAGVAEEMARVLRTQYPTVQVVGTESPPFRPITSEELDDLARRVTGLRANIVWVGLGTPRQDYLVAQLAERVECAIVPVGAAFDFISGRVGEAPRFVQAIGMEWFYRLLTEPRRLWKRYLVSAPAFVLAVAVESFRRYVGRRLP